MIRIAVYTAVNEHRKHERNAVLEKKQFIPIQLEGNGSARPGYPVLSDILLVPEHTPRFFFAGQSLNRNQYLERRAVYMVFYLYFSNIRS
jgi:hypothetical protein